MPRNLLTSFEIWCSKKISYLLRKYDFSFLKYGRFKESWLYASELWILRQYYYKKTNYLLPKYDLPFANMTLNKTVNYLLPKYDPFIQQYDLLKGSLFCASKTWFLVGHIIFQENELSTLKNTFLFQNTIVQRELIICFKNTCCTFANIICQIKLFIRFGKVIFHFIFYCLRKVIICFGTMIFLVKSLLRKYDLFVR